MITFTKQKLPISTLLKLYNESLTKCFKHSKAAKKVVTSKKKYTNTVILPKTYFPAWVAGKERIQLDEKIIKNCEFSNLYNWQRAHVKGPEFILHDGPPYANGLPHMGHAINKILKDITIRYKLLQGHRIHYKPGWDCHGLPIELKAMAKEDVQSMSPLSIRSKARKFVEGAIRDQKAVFRSWGIMADWEDGCYQTYDKAYVKNQLQQFYKLYTQGMIYRDVKPVFWSPSSRSALAEAELEYNEQHKSTTTYVRMKLTNTPATWGKEVYALVWTTTPWTLPANQAIAYNSSLPYCLVTLGSDDREKYLVASATIDHLSATLQQSLNVIRQVDGGELQSITYEHPLFVGQSMPLLASDHVTDNKGTGLVHTAPAHGPDDFKLAKKFNMPIVCLVDEDGCFMEAAGSELEGLSVLSAGNQRVIDMCREQGRLVHVSTLTHSYPYDWRTNLPVILRASHQWFFDTERIKHQAVEALKDVTVLPQQGLPGLVSQVQSRPFWCISRQRVWGIPVPVLFSQDGQPIISQDLVDHYCKLLDTKGDDFWWSCGVSELAPKHLLKPLNIDQQEIEKSQDILDIWLDSGLSWSAVLDTPVADLYLEGVDQFNGWFQSSLMTSMALQQVPPYKTVFVHGYAVDKDGRKMSKSLGNVVNPQHIVYGGNDHINQPTYGVDTLRWWVAAHAAGSKNVPVSETTLTDSKNCVQKLRSVFKFILGALNSSPTRTATTSPSLRHLDVFMLHSLHNLESQICEQYNHYKYNRVCVSLTNFITNEVSGFYCHLTKDRLYCEKECSEERQAVLSTLRHTLSTLIRLIAPILPVLAEEVYTHLPTKDGESMFRSTVIRARAPSEWHNPGIELLMQLALEVRQQVTKLIPLNCSNWQLAVVISADTTSWQQLKALQVSEESTDSELTELLQVSHVTLRHCLESGVNVEISLVKAHQCERCRRFTAPTPEQLCQRCEQVLTSS